MIAQSVAEIIGRHVKLTVEGIDRMYLNVYVPRLKTELGIVQFFRKHRRQPLPSAALMEPMSRGFVAALEPSWYVMRYRSSSSARGLLGSTAALVGSSISLSQRTLA